MRQVKLAILVSLLGLCSLPVAEAKLYKYLDEHGNVHYSDRVPPKFVRQGRSVLSREGIEVEREAPAKTKEQLAQEEKLKQLQAEQQKIREQQEAKDRVLLRTFRSEDDIVMARNGKLAAVDAQIKLANSNIKRLKLRLGNRQSQAAAVERRGSSVNKRLREDIDKLKVQIEDNYRYIVKRKQEKLAISDSYQRDQERFRQLRSLRPGETAAVQKREVSQAFIDTLVPCHDSAECERYWERAKAFAKRYATMPLQISGERIYMTAEPVGNEDISLTVSRLTAEGSTENIFLDIQCRNNSFGEELCNGPRVKQIREQFRGAVSADT